MPDESRSRQTPEKDSVGTGIVFHSLDGKCVPHSPGVLRVTSSFCLARILQVQTNFTVLQILRFSTDVLPIRILFLCKSVKFKFIDHNGV